MMGLLSGEVGQNTTETAANNVSVSESNSLSQLEQQSSNNAISDLSRKKLGRPNFNLGGLSISTNKIPQGIIKLQPIDSLQEPGSANPFLRANNSIGAGSAEFLQVYERAERYIEESGLKIVEPGAETKVRKHIKVLSRSNTLEEECSSPLYTGSPMLTKVSDSSLLARRAFSGQSPLLKVFKMEGERSPVSDIIQSTPLKVEDSQLTLETTKSLGAEPKTSSFKTLFISKDTPQTGGDIVDSPLRKPKNSRKLGDKVSVVNDSEKREE